MTMSQFNKDPNFMSTSFILPRFFLALIIFGSLVFGGCSYIPWMDNDDMDDLAFEEDFPLDDDQAFRDEEDDFFDDDKNLEDDLELDSNEADMFDDDFASIDQRTDKNELKGDVGALQTQQEELISKVRGLEEVLASLGPKINATQEQLEGSLSSVTGQSEYLEPEVEELKLQMARLNKEISNLKSVKGSNSRARGLSRRKISTPPRYNNALSSYRAGKYDESILQFQSFSLANPPERLMDNIEFWIGSNYVKLEMYDDAITQFEKVINLYSYGNKVHDSRFMLGRVYSLKGETSKAVDILQSALKNSPPAEVRAKISKQLQDIQ
jgi:TolA-binding protein